MHEEIEYAEMLEIPVSTVNVVKRRRKHKKPPTLQESLIEKVNEKVSPDEVPEETAVEEPVELSPLPEEGENGQSFVTTLVEDEPLPQAYRRRLPFWKKVRSADGEKSSKAAQLVYRIEFACAGALCLGIFLTNVFMPQSAINTFFRTMTTPSTQEDTRVFSDFTLSPIVGEYSDAVVSVSPAGVISFTAEGCVYPAVDGVVTDVVLTDGTYTVKMEHSPNFTSVLEGVDYVYYQVGETVKHNVPVAFSKGETQVQMTMYSDGELLDCLQIDDENCLAWVETAQ